MSEWSYGHDGVSVCIKYQDRYMRPQDVVANLNEYATRFHDLEAQLAEAVAAKAAAEAACAAMRNALEEVARIGTLGYCAVCGRVDGTHPETCVIGQALAPAAGATLLAQMAVMEATILDVLTNWWNRLYPEDVFIGGPGCDEGVAEVVPLRKAMRDAIGDSAGAAYQREHERLRAFVGFVRDILANEDAVEAVASIVARLAILDAKEPAGG